jgi:hypothetical protein
MCLRRPNFRSKESSHFDTIAASSFVNFPRRSHVNEGEARRVSMLREASSFVFTRTLQNLSRFWFGLFISVKILIFGYFWKNVRTLQRTIFDFTLHVFDGKKWTFIYWFSTVLARIKFLCTFISRGSLGINQWTENLKFTPTEFLYYEISVQGFLGPFLSRK